MEEHIRLIHRTQADVDATMKDVKEKAKAFTEAHRDESAEEILAAMRGEEPVSEDLKKAAAEAFKQIVYENRNSFLELFKAGAKWKAEQMMKNAIDCSIRRNKCTKKNVLNGFDVTCDAIQKFNNGDKVKMIIVKEE